MEMLNWSIEGCQHTRKSTCCHDRTRWLPSLCVARLCRAARTLDVVKEFLAVRGHAQG